LLFTAAAYNLNRYNVPLPDPNNPGFFLLSGSNRIQGFETTLNGYVTPEWQSTVGYAYRRAGDERDIDNGRAGQPYPARSAQSVFVVEQISVYAGMERGTRRRLLL
jgi:Outer membrane receptor for monomeric catechols